MPSPFPGMDPYLEHPAVFPDLHDRLITNLSESLQPLLPEASREPVPALSTEDREWARAEIAKAREHP